MKVIKKDFIEEIKNNCSEILYLSTKHILDKLYKKDEDEIKEYIEIFKNYKNYHLYLNDYAGVIYSRYASSINNLYIEMCNYLKIEIDNKYTLEHTIIKLEKQTPELLLGLTDEDIQQQTILHFDEKIVNISNSTYYNANLDEFKARVDKLKQNISLVKNALQIS
ncbi:MAG: hypothetical protein U9Q30_04570 [Campylobacterota bacterium]|nr:hypothetical protein [Campylobacterota bacterium]